MTIPVGNIYYLLCYAWDRLDQADMVDVSSETGPELVDLLARVVHSGATHLMKHGLDRDYLEREREISGVRGKLLVGQSVTRGSLWSGRAWCAFDELEHDILQNQILKATIDSLTRTADLEKSIREDLRALAQRMPPISPIRLERRDFRRVVIHRNNRLYRFILDVCELIYENLLPEESSGQRRFRDFTRDEGKMAELFERFLLCFYRRHSGMRAQSERVKWQDVECSEADASHLPTLKTDVSLIGAQTYVIAEAKYYQHPLVRSYDKDIIRPGHIRQVYAYLQNTHRRWPERQRPCGLLLYAGVGETFTYEYRIHGFNVCVASVDLSCPWPDIHRRLHDVLDRARAGGAHDNPREVTASAVGKR